MRWFQFRLRTLLLVTLAVALLLGGWCGYVEPYRTQQRAMAAIKKAGGTYETRLGGPAWLRGLFGPQAFQDVVKVDLEKANPSPECLEYVLRLPRLRSLTVSGKEFTDDHLRRLRGMKSLKEAVLWGTSVSRDAVDTLEQGRPDLDVAIGLTVDSLASWPGADAFALVRPAAEAFALTRTEVEARLNNLPPALRQWVGKRVRVMGWPWSTADSPSGWQATSMSMILREYVWRDPLSQLIPKVGVYFRGPIDERPFKNAAFSMLVEGIFEVGEPGVPYWTVYRLRDASLVKLHAPEPVTPKAASSPGGR